MKNCQKCESERIAFVSGHCSDSCYIEMPNIPKEQEGYVPLDMGISPKYCDNIAFSWCLDCGQIQGKFPLEPCEIERS